MIDLIKLIFFFGQSNSLIFFLLLTYLCLNDLSLLFFKKRNFSFFYNLLWKYAKFRPKQPFNVSVLWIIFCELGAKRCDREFCVNNTFRFCLYLVCFLAAFILTHQFLSFFFYSFYIFILKRTQNIIFFLNFCLRKINLRTMMVFKQNIFAISFFFVVLYT